MSKDTGELLIGKAIHINVVGLYVEFVFYAKFPVFPEPVTYVILYTILYTIVFFVVVST